MHFFFTINSLTFNLERRLGLLFKLDNFSGGACEVVEITEYLAFRDPLYPFVNFLVRGYDIFSRFA